MKKRSFVSSMYISIVFLFLFTGVLPLVVYGVIHYNNYIKGNQKLIRTMININNSQIGKMIHIGDIHKLHQTLGRLCEDLELLKCEIKSTNGTPLFLYSNGDESEENLNSDNHPIIYGGKKLGTLRVYQLKKHFFDYLIMSPLPILFVVFFMIVIFVFIKRYIKNPLDNMLEFLFVVKEDNIIKQNKNSEQFTEFELLKSRIIGLIADRDKSNSKAKELEKQKAVLGLAQQVAHDIRSPLAALNMISKDINSLPEVTRLMLRGSVSRIQDIANNLLEQNKVKGEIKDKQEVYLLAPIIESIISEKRTQLRSKMNIDLSSDVERTYGLFASLEQSHLKRILSNLINNASEAFDSPSGKITVGLKEVENSVIITVKDNGKGIPEEIVKKLGVKGASFGKDSSETSGSGLGLAHAKQYIQKWGGQFEIKSALGKGTSITLTLPTAKTPSWFVSEIKVHTKKKIVIIDDDSTIHQIWDKKLTSFNIKERGIQVVHFTNPHDVVSWVKNNKPEDAIFLCDFEFIGHETNGLGLIEKLNISRYSTLVTSRYEEDDVRRKCESLGVGLIPKSMAEIVPISIAEQDEANPVQESKYDIVHIDDDELMRMTWSFKAKSKGIKILSLASRTELSMHFDEIEKETSFYIDSCLGDDLPRGEEIAKELHEKGYTNLFLSTGYDKKDLPSMPWIKEVIGKNPPFA